MRLLSCSFKLSPIRAYHVVSRLQTCSRKDLKHAVLVMRSLYGRKSARCRMHQVSSISTAISFPCTYSENSFLFLHLIDTRPPPRCHCQHDMAYALRDEDIGACYRGQNWRCLGDTHCTHWKRPGVARPSPRTYCPGLAG